MPLRQLHENDYHEVKVQPDNKCKTKWNVCFKVYTEELESIALGKAWQRAQEAAGHIAAAG